VECGTCAVVLKEEHRLGEDVEKRILRRIFGPKRAKVTEGWGKTS
jgi:hypothetical protein